MSKTLGVMARNPRTKKAILGLLADGKPHSHREVASSAKLTGPAVWNALLRLWKNGAVLRTRLPIYEQEKVFKGRGGTSNNLRPYHLYIVRSEGVDRMRVGGHEFVNFSKEHLDARGKGGKGSKARMVLEFLERNKSRAFFSKEIADALKDKGVKVRDIMPNVKRFERKGLVYVSGYRSGDKRTPFTEGYLITWLDPTKPREQAIEEAIKRGDSALEQKGETSPHYLRVHRIRDIIFAESKKAQLISTNYLQKLLNCTEYEVERSLKRAVDLYPSEIKQVKIFDFYRYFYHSSIDVAKLDAMVKMKENEVRREKGGANRTGHNWEAAVEWFIEAFTSGADFKTQKHREKGMDPKRITLYLIKNVGNRRKKAEVDRVWEVRTSPFSPPTTNVLSCKWGKIHREHLKDFYEVLRWSKEFGVNTPDGRQVRQGVVGVFAGSTFEPSEKIRLKDETEVSLPEYARRMDITLIKAVDLNERLHQHGCPQEITVQKICKWAKDERQVRETLDAIWGGPQKAGEILERVREGNIGLYQFERRLEGSGEETSKRESDE